MKVFIVTDMEGISGCVYGGYGKSLDSLTCQRYHSLMMGEINAVVEGCVKAGAEEIIVGEAHPIDLEKLHPEAKLARGIPWHEAMSLRDYDAALFVGQHAMAGLEKAVRAHTGSSNSIIGFWINDKPSGELAYLGGFLGSISIPVIFLSGDTAACSEAENLIKNITTVEVEESHNSHGAVCLPPDKTRKILIDGVIKAFESKDKIEPVRFTVPVTFKIEFRYPKIADEFCYISGSKRESSKTVSYTADTYQDTYMAVMPVLSSILVKYDS